MQGGQLQYKPECNWATTVSTRMQGGQLQYKPEYKVDNYSRFNLKWALFYYTIFLFTFTTYNYLMLVLSEPNRTSLVK